MPGDDDQKLPAPIAPGGDPAARAALQRAREVRDRTIARLSDGFAHDLLDVEEFERRVTRAQTSESPDEIAALAADLPGASEVPVPASAPQAALIPAAEAEPRRTVVAIMGGVDRRGAWTMPQGSGQLIETQYGWTGFGPPWGGNPPVPQSRFDAQTYVQYALQLADFI